MAIFPIRREDLSQLNGETVNRASAQQASLSNYYDAAILLSDIKSGFNRCETI
jgi:hypothetical protein